MTCLPSISDAHSIYSEGQKYLNPPSRLPRRTLTVAETFGRSSAELATLTDLCIPQFKMQHLIFTVLATLLAGLLYFVYSILEKRKALDGLVGRVSSPHPNNPGRDDMTTRE